MVALRSMYEARVNDLKRRLDKAGLQGALILSPNNVYYMSGFNHYVRIRMHCVVVPAEGEVTFITPKIEHEYAVHSSWVSDVRYFVEFPEPAAFRKPLDLVEEVLKEKGLGTQALGIEHQAVSVGQFNDFKERFPSAEWRDISPVLAEMRLVKSPEELGLLRLAGELAIAEWETAINTAAVDVPEFEVALAARDAGTRFAAEHFSDDDAFLSPMVNGTQIMIAGGRSSIPHGRASTRRLRANEVVMMCFCMVNQFKGYRVGFTRHFSIGSVSEEVRKAYKVVWEAQEAAIDAVRPGVTASWIDEVARAHLAKFDMEKWLTHRTGRGVGLDIAEGPELKEGDDTPLEPGMTFSVEPAVYVPGQFGIQIEDTVVVTEDGSESLTPIDKNLVIL